MVLCYPFKGKFVKTFLLNLIFLFHKNRKKQCLGVHTYECPE